MAPQLTLRACLNMFPDPVPDRIVERMRQFESTGLCVYANVDLSSRDVGHRFAIGFGPNNTLTGPPEDDVCRVRPPFGQAWQFRLAVWCRLPRSVDQISVSD